MKKLIEKLKIKYFLRKRSKAFTRGELANELRAWESLKIMEKQNETINNLTRELEAIKAKKQ